MRASLGLVGVVAIVACTRATIVAWPRPDAPSARALWQCGPEPSAREQVHPKFDRAWADRRVEVTSMELGTGEIEAVWFRNTDEGWLVNTWGWQLHTTDGGVSWQPVPKGTTPFAVREVVEGEGTSSTMRIDHLEVLSDDAVVAFATSLDAASVRGSAWASKDGGATWTRAVAPVQGVRAVAHAGRDVWACGGSIDGDREVVVRSRDGGATFEIVAREPEFPVITVHGGPPAGTCDVWDPAWCSGLSFIDEHHGWMIENPHDRLNANDRVVATDDGGVTWHPLAALPFFDREQGVLLDFVERLSAMDGVVDLGARTAVTRDGGKSWQVGPATVTTWAKPGGPSPIASRIPFDGGSRTVVSDRRLDSIDEAMAAPRWSNRGHVALRGSNVVDWGWGRTGLTFVDGGRCTRTWSRGRAPVASHETIIEAERIGDHRLVAWSSHAALASDDDGATWRQTRAFADAALLDAPWLGDDRGVIAEVADRSQSRIALDSPPWGSGTSLEPWDMEVAVAHARGEPTPPAPWACLDDAAPSQLFVIASVGGTNDAWRARFDRAGESVDAGFTLMLPARTLDSPETWAHVDASTLHALVARIGAALVLDEFAHRTCDIDARVLINWRCGKGGGAKNGYVFVGANDPRIGALWDALHVVMPAAIDQAVVDDVARRARLRTDAHAAPTP